MTFHTFQIYVLIQMFKCLCLGYYCMYKTIPGAKLFSIKQAEQPNHRALSIGILGAQ